MCLSRRLFAFILTSVFCLPGLAQLVISIHSGVIHFSEGAVFIDDQPLEQKFGTFPAIKEGSILRTEQGRAEILLTPGVFLRIDENTSVRMISSALKDTRLELLQGSAILDSLNRTADNTIVIVFKASQIRFPEKGVYRMDSEPPVLQVYNGQAEVTREGKPSLVDSSHLFFFSLGLETQKYGEGDDDDFFQWSNERSQFISADNRAAAQSTADPGQMDSDPGARDPNVYLGSPGPSYGGIVSPVPLDSSFLYLNAPFGPGIWNMYTAYFIYLPRYSRLPTRPLSPAHSPWPVRTRYPGLPPTRITLPRRSPVGTSTFAPRPVPRTTTVAPRYYSPTPAAPRVGAVHVGAPGIHR